MSSASASAVSLPKSDRIVSLDQFRGYTVVGMLLVNYLGGFAACPTPLRHSHDYNSYADTIMPQFLFAVGFAFRLTFGRRAQLQGTAGAYGRVVRRLLGLVLVSLIIYQVGPRAPSWQKLTHMGFWDIFGEPLKRNWFETLMHIAVTALWLVPVIRASAAARVAWMVASAVAHVGLSYWFNYLWVNTGANGIDGGPLGFLTWTIPATVGTLACDAVADHAGKPKLGRMLGWASVLMLLGYVFSCGTRFYDVPANEVASLHGQRLSTDPVWPGSAAIEAKLHSGNIHDLLAEPPFIPPPGAEQHERITDLRKWWLDAPALPSKDKEEETKKTDLRKWNYWMMSQRGGTLSYLTFSAGFSLAVYVLFYLACDRWGFKLRFFQTFGTNALLAYILHDMVGSAIERFVPKDVPGWYLTCSLVLFFAINWLVLRHFEKQGVYLRV
jgi:predicted acyltransferase